MLPVAQIASVCIAKAGVGRIVVHEIAALVSLLPYVGSEAAQTSPGVVVRSQHLGRRLVRLASVMFVMAAMNEGCTPHDGRRPITVVMGWDTSTSNRARLPEGTRLGVRLIRQLDPVIDRITLYRVDSEVAEFYNGHPPASREALQRLLIRELGPPPAQAVTRPAVFWREALTAVQVRQERSVVVFITDGQNDDQSGAAIQELHTTVHALAKERKVERVCIWGVENAQRRVLKRDFAPLGDRFYIRGFADANVAQALPDSSAQVAESGNQEVSHGK